LRQEEELTVTRSEAGFGKTDENGLEWSTSDWGHTKYRKFWANSERIEKTVWTERR